MCQRMCPLDFSTFSTYQHSGYPTYFRQSLSFLMAFRFGSSNAQAMHACTALNLRSEMETWPQSWRLLKPLGGRLSVPRCQNRDRGELLSHGALKQRTGRSHYSHYIPSTEQCTQGTVKNAKRKQIPWNIMKPCCNRKWAWELSAGCISNLQATYYRTHAVAICRYHPPKPRTSGVQQVQQTERAVHIECPCHENTRWKDALNKIKIPRNRDEPSMVYCADKSWWRAQYIIVIYFYICAYVALATHIHAVHTWFFSTQAQNTRQQHDIAYC